MSLVGKILTAIIVSTLLTSPLLARAMDSDNDGYDDQIEIKYGYSPYAANKKLAESDADNDGLNDELELKFKTDPLNVDTDNDGYNDGQEITQGYDPTNSQPVRLPKKIAITLATQRLAYYLGEVKLGEFPISSGVKALPTPVGEFKIYKKQPRTWSKAGQLWMPWWMSFYSSGLYAIHELPEWPSGKKEGADHLGKPASHGCVRLGVGPAKMLYDWAPIGTKVMIRK